MGEKANQASNSRTIVSSCDKDFPYFITDSQLLGKCPVRSQLPLTFMGQACTTSSVQAQKQHTPTQWWSQENLNEKGHVSRVLEGDQEFAGWTQHAF